MGKVKAILTNFRVIILMICIVLAVLAIRPTPWNEGVMIRSVALNSSASLAGMVSPVATQSLMSRERIIEINGAPIKNTGDYYSFIEKLQPNRTYTFKTDKGLYRLYSKTGLDGNAEDIGLRVSEAPTTNIRKGLDLQGGIRVLLQPEKPVSVSDMGILLENMAQRLNVYGLSDIVVKEAKDLSGNQYVTVEIAGVNEEEVKDLIAKQGKFEAFIGNTTVFRGGKNDITYVCRTADCSGIDPNVGCSVAQDNLWYCRFRFSITLAPEAADRQAAATGDLQVVQGQGDDNYLSEPLLLYLDNKEVDRLNIGAELKGQAVTSVAVSGSGLGKTQEEAVADSLKNMKKLQTVMITGSLPVQLNIVKTDSISPILGEQFIRNSWIIAIASMIAVSLVIFIKYRKWKISVPVIITMLAEITCLLGIAAIIGWNIDIAAIAGIIVTIGTGVNDQIVITDETLSGRREQKGSWKNMMKRAFFIIFAAFFTNVVAMLPLWFAGAGLLKGFAVTTILGITVGVLVTRPAYAQIVGMLVENEPDSTPRRFK
ncbi:MAG: preprotein translocase subunit SecD [archaeon GW2011_AR3]|nr:MAG: preprotein translocase subunit SecD [archaeon GW2011_AR3]MBS3110152.1 hypothetical protein [Candidatus Woesearchaeota archaeon]